MAVLFRHVALFDVHGTPARHRPQALRTKKGTFHDNRKCSQRGRDQG
ncbi:MAG: hypothetical protein E5Y59_13335, partial [Mesorhizobium sp.]